MLSLIVTILFALAIAYFAIQNTLGVTLVIANNIFNNVPLFSIVIGSVLLGVLLSSVISGLNSLTSYMRLRGKDHVIQEDAKAIHMLQEKVHGLEVENAQLKNGEKKIVEQHVVETTPVQRPTFHTNIVSPRA